MKGDWETGDIMNLCVENQRDVAFRGILGGDIRLTKLGR